MNAKTIGFTVTFEWSDGSDLRVHGPGEMRALRKDTVGRAAIRGRERKAARAERRRGGTMKIRLMGSPDLVRAWKSAIETSYGIHGQEYPSRRGSDLRV